MPVFIIIVSVVILISVNYILIVKKLTEGFNKLHNSKTGKEETGALKQPAIGMADEAIVKKVVDKKMISIIIAARNEERNIGTCIESLQKQDYPKELFEVIVVNDQSEDATSGIIESYEQLNLIDIKQLITLGEGGKKAAISLGVSKAKGDFILITDADCLVPPTWISEFNRCFNETEALFITGPVMLKPETGFFNKFQCLEFNSLIASTAGYIGINKPVMCNGANMGYSVSTYQELLCAKSDKPEQADILRSNITSGDDVFLMLSMKRKFGAESITFLNSASAIVFTHTQPDIKHFIAQRIRWVSKSNGYRDHDVIVSAISIYSFNLICFLLIPATLVLPFFKTTGNLVYTLAIFLLTGLLLIAKTTVDYMLLAAYSKVYGQKQLLKFLPVFEFIVIAYTTMIGALGGFMPFKWKGRLFRK